MNRSSSAVCFVRFAWLFAMLAAAPSVRAQVVTPPTTAPAAAPSAIPATPAPAGGAQAGAAWDGRLVSIFAAGAMAPATAHVNALPVPLAAGTPLTARYEWDFGDEGARYNRLVGWNAAHTYDRPGTYTIRLTVTDESGGVTRHEQQVTVQPDRRLPIYVAADGDDRNPGNSPAKPKRSVARALAGAGDNTSILLRRGDRFDLPAALKPRARNLLIGAYGETSSALFGLPAVASIALPDDRPRLVWTGERRMVAMVEPQQGTMDLVVQDVAFDTVFNKDAEKKNMPIGLLPRGINTTVRRCTFYNVGDGLNANQRPRGVLMQDCAAPTLTGLRSYLAWIEGSDHVYLGNLAFNSTREAVMRVGLSGAARVLVAHNTLCNLDRTAVDKIDTAKNALTVQFGSHVYVASNTLLIGPVIVGPLGQKDGLPQKDWRLRTVVVEDNRISRSQLRIAHGTIGLAVRNNRFWANDRTAINVEGFSRDYNRGSGDLLIAHNTVFNQGSKGNFLRVGGGVEGIGVRNNLYSAPNIAPGSHETAVVYVAQGDLAGFREIAGNVWPTCKPYEFANGGVFYVWPTWSDARGYLTLEAWRGLPGVDGDEQADVKVDDALRPAALPGSMRRPMVPGVRFDADGRPRDPSGTTPGACEATPNPPQ